MKNTKTIISIFAAAFALSSAAIAQNATCANGYTAELPCGNFGLNALSQKISDTQNKIASDTGITLSFDYYADIFSNPSGGVAQGTNYTHIMIFGADIDLQKIAGIKNASITVSGAYNAGRDLSGKIGNFYTVSQSAITAGVMFYEMYYTQKFELCNGDTLAFKAGRMSMSDDFAGLPVFGYLAGGAMDSAPEAIFYASPFTSQTLAAWGISATYQTCADLAFSAGLYQVPDSINDSGWHGTYFGMGNNDGYMIMAQMAWSPTLAGDLDGIYQLGGYFFDGYDMSYLDASRAGFKSDGFGFYIQGQQEIWVDSPDKNRAITIWAGAQFAPVKSTSPITWQTYAGLQFAGFVPHRPDDSVFLSWTSGFFSGNYNNGNSDCETVLEANYLFTVNSNISLQPVVQYIIDPRGDSDISNAFVLGGQLLVSF